MIISIGTVWLFGDCLFLFSSSRCVNLITLIWLIDTEVAFCCWVLKVAFLCQFQSHRVATCITLQWWSYPSHPGVGNASATCLTSWLRRNDVTSWFGDSENQVRICIGLQINAMQHWKTIKHVRYFLCERELTGGFEPACRSRSKSLPWSTKRWDDVIHFPKIPLSFSFNKLWLELAGSVHHRHVRLAIPRETNSFNWPW